MVAEKSLFQKIVDSLASLNKEELLKLGKLFWDMETQEHSNAKLKGQSYSAEAVFSDQVSDETLSSDEIKQAIEDLNPAEVSVLHTLITWHLDKVYRHDGQSISASW